jgi:hypothetical protein
MAPMLSPARVLPVVLFLGLFAMAARDVVDPDVWWHLETGQYISEHTRVPRVDPFSYTRGGAPWVAHEWLADLLLYGIQRVAGWGALIVLFAAIVTASFFVLYLRCGSRPGLAGLITLLAACATMPLWGVRPQILSLLLTSLWLLLLERSERDPKLLWWTLPLMLLWVNLHAGFALGLALSAVFLAGEWIEGLRRKSARGGMAPSGISPNPGPLRLAALIFLLDLLLVPLNPNGPRLFDYPLETLRSTAMQSYIAEWASPNFHQLESLPLLVLVLASFVILAWTRSPMRQRDFLLLPVSLFASLVSIRLIPFFVLIAAPLLARQWAGALPSRSGNFSKSSSTSTALHALLNAGMILTLALFAVVHTIQVIHRQPQAVAQAFPERAVAFLQSHPGLGPIFNHYDWGGYLIWKLYPETRVFIDGRADLYGDSMLDPFASTYQFKGDWRRPLERWDIHTVLVPSHSALAVGLGNAPGWSVAYGDAQAVVLTDRPGSLVTLDTR